MFKFARTGSGLSIAKVSNSFNLPSCWNHGSCSFTIIYILHIAAKRESTKKERILFLLRKNFPFEILRVYLHIALFCVVGEGIVWGSNLFLSLCSRITSSDAVGLYETRGLKPGLGSIKSKNLPCIPYTISLASEYSLLSKDMQVVKDTDKISWICF